jgi:translation initiation factor 1
MSINSRNILQGFTIDIDDEIIVVENKIHIRLKKRNARKCVTTVEGINETLDFKKIIKHLRHKFNCGGIIAIDEDTENKVLQLTGDQRDNLKNFLIEEKIAIEEDIIVHGY